MRQISYIGNMKNDDLQNIDKPIVICGAGRRGKKIYQYLKRRNIKIKFFYDSNIEDEHYEEIPIKNLKMVKAEDEFIYIVSGLYAAEILNYLIENGIANIHIFLD